MRKGLPAAPDAAWADYFEWAVNAAAKLAASGVEDTTQIHAHVLCRSNDIIDAIAAHGRGRNFIESTLEMELLDAFIERNMP